MSPTQSRDTSPGEGAPPLPDEQPPLPADSPSASVTQPPLPTESQHEEVVRKATVAEAEDEDEVEDEGDNGVVEERDEAAGEAQGEEWDPSRGGDLSDRQAVQEKTSGSAEVSDTKGWQAVWAPQANGESAHRVPAPKGACC